MRPSGRKTDQMRKVSFERNFSKHAEGSCLVRFGDTHVLCTASLEEKPPAWLRNSGKGWVTAEYGMLPRATGGIFANQPVIDLDYLEDSAAETDANFVLTGTGGIVEIQGTAEGAPFSEEEFLSLLKLAKAGTEELVAMQKQAIAQ